ncbi:hypothetical protein FRC08_005169 [Ceratobasidium sp. 394]|nr:hypothetical protein FRC08_005169 [Ceratobasidium sp. 394]KAG9083285.1 hypothetical protein FS749_006156 [Ceratobasidium sp. UAMH 11750]
MFMRGYGGPTGLLDLPPELLFDILVHSVSPQFPLANKHLLHTFKHASPFVRAEFILYRYYDSLDKLHGRPSPTSVMHAALSYPMCAVLVLDALERISPPLLALSSADRRRLSVSPGRWLFRNLYTDLKPKRRKPGPLAAVLAPSSAPQNPRSNPLSFLELLGSRYTLAFPERESAFALSMCVRAGPAQYPLLRFLLYAGADPGASHCLALQVAATVGNMDAMRMLVEPSDADIKHLDERVGKVGGGKRRRVADRVRPTSKVLLTAVKAKHTELAYWLMHEKGVVPDMATIRMLQHT